jgi:uncharacterized protein YecE (DUF72 family)
MLFAGTSGFSYSTWKGKFYPATLAGSKMLSYYAGRLNGVELNGSFYRTPPETALQKWASETPPGFRFCMKANRGLTYSADAFDRVGLARIFTQRIAVLGDRLGPVLLQFPPVRKKNVVLLDALLAALERPAAVEFRDESWFDDDVYEVLRDRGAALVVTDEPKWPRAPLKHLCRFTYIRLRRGYAKDGSLDEWYEHVREAMTRHDEVYVFFKHDSASPRLARKMLRLVAGETVSRPRRSGP